MYIYMPITPTKVGWGDWGRGGGFGKYYIFHLNLYAQSENPVLIGTYDCRGVTVPVHKSINAVIFGSAL